MLFNENKRVKDAAISEVGTEKSRGPQLYKKKTRENIPPTSKEGDNLKYLLYLFKYNLPFEKRTELRIKMQIMKEPLKYFLERTTPIGNLARMHRNRQLRRKFVRWKKAGATGAMPNYGKQQLVIDYIRRFSPSTFIETGTYNGKMVYAVMPYINEIYSIELDETLYRNVYKRFIGYPNIHIIHGQSGEVLPELLKNINNRCIFWLDAHYSRGSTAKGKLETPIMQELECILNHPKVTEHVMLIDDASCFTGENDYPALETLEKFVRSNCPEFGFYLENDIVRIHLPT